MRSNTHRIQTVALLCCVGLLSGCSLLTSSEMRPDQVPLAQSAQSEDPHAQMPFEMKILNEVNDGAQLHVLGSIHSNALWDPASVVIRLTTLNSGEVLGVTYHPLSRILEQNFPLDGKRAARLGVGEEVQFSLAAPALGVTDYQLELLWGAEATQFLEQKKTPQNLMLRVRKIEVETLRSDCSDPPCEINFRLKGRLHNEGDASISNVVLGVGFIDIESSPRAVDLVPDQEERVEIPNLKLFPGESRPFRLLLKRTLREDEADEVRPVLRVISFEGN